MQRVCLLRMMIVYYINLGRSDWQNGPIGMRGASLTNYVVSNRGIL